jgi:hypothetical protein
MATRQADNTEALGDQVAALAEQLGRIAGTLEGTAESWLTRQSLTDQLTRVRDRAAEMLDRLASDAKKKNQKRAPRARAAARRADLSRAPGKRRRKPAPNKRGVKKSNQMIAKSRTAAAVRRRRKYEGRGTRR